MYKMFFAGNKFNEKEIFFKAVEILEKKKMRKPEEEKKLIISLYPTVRTVHGLPSSHRPTNQCPVHRQDHY
jgi:hypothetical protein